MATVRTFNFKSAMIGRTRVEFRQGLLTYRTRDTGISEWEASGDIPGGDTRMVQLLNSREMLDAEFATNIGPLSGHVFVAGYRDSSSRGMIQARIRLAGTGPLEGWPVK